MKEWYYDVKCNCGNSEIVFIKSNEKTVHKDACYINEEILTYICISCNRLHVIKVSHAFER